MSNWPNYDFPEGPETGDEETPPSRGQKVLRYFDAYFVPAIGRAGRASRDSVQMIISAFVGATFAITFSNLSGADQMMPGHASGAIFWLLMIYFLLSHFEGLWGEIFSGIWKVIYDYWGP